MVVQGHLFTFYQGKSPLNHHVGRLFLELFPRIEKVNPRLRSPSQMKNTELPGTISRIARKMFASHPGGQHPTIGTPKSCWIHRLLPSLLQLGQLVGFTGMKYRCWFGNPVNSPVEVGIWNPIIYKVLYIPGGSFRFLRSTASHLQLGAPYSTPLKETASNI